MMAKTTPLTKCIYTTLCLLVFCLTHPGSSSEAADPQLNSSDLDPNTIPNLLKTIDSIFFLDPNAITDSVDSSLAQLDQPTEASANTPITPLWGFQYHPQVDDRLFGVMKYPYFPSGESYANPAMSLRADNLATQAYAEQADEAMASHRATGLIPSVFRNIDTVSALVYRWRMINESPGTTLEVIHSVELTKTATDIYCSHPDLAITVKRTLGHVGLLNQKFDLLSRITIETIVRGENAGPLISRLKKQLSDLETLLTLLTQQNDSIRLALGLDKIDREIISHGEYETIDYAKHRLPKVSL